MTLPAIPSVSGRSAGPRRRAVEIGRENRWTQAGAKLAHGIAAAAHRADERDFACRAGIAHPVGVAAGGWHDKIRMNAPVAPARPRPRDEPLEPAAVAATRWPSGSFSDRTLQPERPRESAQPPL